MNATKTTRNEISFRPPPSPHYPSPLAVRDGPQAHARARTLLFFFPFYSLVPSFAPCSATAARLPPHVHPVHRTVYVSTLFRTTDKKIQRTGVAFLWRRSEAENARYTGTSDERASSRPPLKNFSPVILSRSSAEPLFITVATSLPSRLSFSAFRLPKNFHTLLPRSRGVKLPANRRSYKLFEKLTLSGGAPSPLVYLRNVFEIGTPFFFRYSPSFSSRERFGLSIAVFLIHSRLRLPRNKSNYRITE